MQDTIEISTHKLIIAVLILVSAFIVMLAIFHLDPQYWDNLGDEYLGWFFYGTQPQALFLSWNR